MPWYELIFYANILLLRNSYEKPRFSKRYLGFEISSPTQNIFDLDCAHMKMKMIYRLIENKLENDQS